MVMPQSHTHLSPHVFCDLSLYQHHADDGAISAPEGQSWRCAALFRMGDFYELFQDDAVVASKALNIALTARNKQQHAPIPMCGVPIHSA